MNLIYIIANKIGDIGAKYIFEVLKDNKSLTTLYLECK